MSPRQMLGAALFLIVLLLAPVLTIVLFNYMFGLSIAITLVNYILVLAIYIIVVLALGVGAWFAAKVQG